MKLVVGLGNPGKKYEGTRHNVGFEILNGLHQVHQGSPQKSKFSGLISEIGVMGQKLLLLWPQTYMNLSGNSVRAAVDFYKLNIEDVLVVCDDFNLPLAKLRLKGKGSAGGQNGLADVLKKLGSPEVPRLRVGIGAPKEQMEITAFVLGNFSRSERSEMDDCVHRGAAAVEDWATKGLTAAMNDYNR